MNDGDDCLYTYYYRDNVIYPTRWNMPQLCRVRKNVQHLMPRFHPSMMTNRLIARIKTESMWDAIDIFDYLTNGDFSAAYIPFFREVEMSDGWQDVNSELGAGAFELFRQLALIASDASNWVQHARELDALLYSLARKMHCIHTETYAEMDKRFILIPKINHENIPSPMSLYRIGRILSFDNEIEAVS